MLNTIVLIGYKIVILVLRLVSTDLLVTLRLLGSYQEIFSRPHLDKSKIITLEIKLKQ